MDRPEFIYKYEPFSAQSLKNLKAQSIYFGSPLGFNDPYDCALSAGVKEPSESELEEFKKAYSGREDVPENIREEFKRASHSDLKEFVTNSAKSILESHIQTFLNGKGVSCFSEKNNDLLMWSHYGGRYKGYCLEFSTDCEPFTKMRKVKYTDKMPEFDAIKAMLNDDFDEILDLFCTKSQSWSYENEWRCLHHHAGTLFTYDAKALKAVYFGPDIDQQSMEIVCLILLGQNPEVEFWRGLRSQERFEVNFGKFTYLSYTEAKSRGLI